MPKKKNLKHKQTKTRAKTPQKNNKTFWLICSLILIVIGGSLLIHGTKTTSNITSLSAPQTDRAPVTFDFGNQPIMLNNKQLTFMHGIYTDPNTTYGQHTATITDRNVNPTENRAAAILIDNPGGSGLFYYLVGATKNEHTEIYSTPILLGDRIKVQWINVENPQQHNNGVITVQYLDRPQGTPMSTEPTVSVMKKFAFQEDGNLIEILH